MGKVAGFLEYPRINPTYRPVADRIHDYHEVVGLLPEEEVVRQSARCVDCGVPFCHLLGCPLFNVVPDFNDMVYQGEWEKAYQRLESTNNFPEFTGRVCPAPCEASCTLAVNTNAVSIRQIELSIIEKAFERGWVIPRPPSAETGTRVAIIGSGPAGLAAAQQLRRMGHAVTVYEKADKPGGLLRYGIPDFKLEKRLLDRRLQQMSEEGVRFETGVSVGKDLPANELKKMFDAVVITAGAAHARDLGVPGRELEGVHFAMDYLIQSNFYVAGARKKEDVIWAENKRVLVIGGGDTGADCVGTAVRQGAKKVIQFEILEKPPAWDKAFNPDWPDWPKILRISSSHEEGCDREWSVATRKFTGKNGKVKKGHFVRLEWKQGAEGKQPSMAEIPQSEFTLDVDLVFLAMGFLHVEHGQLTEGLGLTIDDRGNIRTNGKYAATANGVFVAGDAMTGASLVSRAIWHGREAAKYCNEYMRGLKK